MRVLYVAKHNSGDNDVTTLPRLAREFGVTKTAIQYIASGRNWRHL